MKEPSDIVKAIKQHLEIDSFMTGDFGVRGDGIDFEQVAQDVEPIEVSEKQEEPKHREIEAENPMAKKDVAVELKKLVAQIEKCKDCELSESRINAVPGEGSSKARIVFVGEAPGADEDKSGRPFVGRSGQLLTKIIEAMRLSREEVYICNTLKCRPPANRDPKPAEKKACRHFLTKQLEIIKPEIIVALGSHAAKGLLEVDKPIGQLRGKFHDFLPEEGAEPIKLMPTYHPSYLLRNYNYDSRKRVWGDMQTVLKELGLPVPRKNPTEK